MVKVSDTSGETRTLEILLLSYMAASLLHFHHNAEYIQAYPNLPAWVTQTNVYLVWFAISSFGLVGYGLYRSGLRWVGLTLLCLYAAVGLDGLLHYTRAPISAHSYGMNFTIWFEVAVASILLLYLLVRAKRLAAR